MGKQKKLIINRTLFCKLFTHIFKTVDKGFNCGTKYHIKQCRVCKIQEMSWLENWRPWTTVQFYKED